jgi:hypothetical protein
MDSLAPQSQSLIATPQGHAQNRFTPARRRLIFQIVDERIIAYAFSETRSVFVNLDFPQFAGPFVSARHCGAARMSFTSGKSML